MPFLTDFEVHHEIAPLLAIFLTGIVVVYPACITIYNIFFHPLRKFPGPKLSSASRFYYDYITFRGLQTYRTRDWHEKYGEIVRVTPNQLSFTNERAWKDIYMHQQGRPQLQKVELLPVRKRAPDLLQAPDDIHTRQRKMVSHAFSDRNLREQEPMLKSYVDNLIRNLQVDARDKKVTNMVQEYNFTTFDIIGDFAFGESFHMLETRRTHPFIKLLFSGTRLLTKFTALANSLELHELVKMLVTYGGQFSDFKPMEWIHEKVGSRISSGEFHRPDLFTNILRAKAEYGDQMPREEIDAIAAVLLGAGSETTATLLSGLTNFLLLNPRWMERLKAEIREAFDTVEDVTIARINKLPCLQAIVEESLRLYPPVPVVMARITPPGGTMICGHFIPEKMIVGIPFYASHSSTMNFSRPLEFHPERWLPDPPPEFKNDSKGSLQPFSAGPRNCIGKNLAYAEMKMMVTRVLFQFDMEQAEPKKIWQDQRAFTIWEKSPLMVRLTDRLA